MPRRPLEIPEHRDDGADEHIPQPPFRSALSDLPFCFRNSGRRSAAFSRGERRSAAPGSRQAFPHPRRRTRQLVGRDGDAGRYHTARDGATAPEYGTGAGCVGTGGAERRVLDFSILDHWIDIARQQHLHLVLLWFGAWKNAFSEYAPDWVKADMKRFPRAQSAHGMPTEILSTFGTETLRADSRAFRSL